MTEQRLAALEEVAGNYGFQFRQGVIARHSWPDVLRRESVISEIGFETSFQSFWPFHHAIQALFENLLTGTFSGYEWTIFDFVDCALPHESNTDHALRDITTSFGVVGVRLPVRLPHISIQRESPLHRLAGHLGWEEVRFECEPFNRRFAVHASDAKTAYEILHPLTLDYLLQLPPRIWQLGDRQLILVTPERLDPAQIPTLISELIGFVQLIPRFVLADCSLRLEDEARS